MTSRRSSRVLKKVRALLPNQDPDAVMKILDQYGLEPYEEGRTRVQLAILKVFQEGISEGESPEDGMDRLRRLVRSAKSDFRDVVAWAEYPGEIQRGFVGMKKMSPEEAREVRRQDREQYERWLKGS